MIVNKFGGVSTSTSANIKKVVSIIKECKGLQIVVFSAMGKSTNALESILESVCNRDTENALIKYEELKSYHLNIVDELALDGYILDNIFEDIKNFIELNLHSNKDFEYRYDYLISMGEMLSSTILSKYIQEQGLKNKLLDMREIMITNESHKSAQVNYEKTTERLMRALSLGFDTYVVQGFIGGTIDGDATTIGREGSDYSAAVIGSILNADTVTIWKDVDGVYNADPKDFPDATLIEQIPYGYALELAFSGAKVMHPNTIKPLENKKIPLYVKPYINPSLPGTVINDEKIWITKPIFIVLKNQNILSVSARDLSFILEESLADIIDTIHKYKQKINLIQTTAISVSVCLDNNRYFDELINELQEKYVVLFNQGLEVLTIKNYNDDILSKERKGFDVFIEQRTHRTVKIVRKKISENES